MTTDPRPRMPIDPTDEDLARDWTLSEPDVAEVHRCRGDDHRQRFALQLCALRNLGYFIDDFAGVPVRIVNHLGRQLGMGPSLFVSAVSISPRRSGVSSR